MIKVHLFWAYGNLSKLELLSVKSFLKNDFDVYLWSYDMIGNVPKGCNLRDARVILPEEHVFLNQKNSYASFADLFRYALLNKEGGLYSDIDVICLKSASKLPSNQFLVTERTETRKIIKNFFRNLLRLGTVNRVNNNVIYNPNPRAGNIIDLSFGYSLRFPKEQIKWSELGPKLLSAFTEIYPNHNFTIMPPDFANPISQHKCPKLLLKNTKLPNSTFFLHCYNEKWRKANVDKNAPYPEGSLLYKLEERYK